MTFFQLEMTGGGRVAIFPGTLVAVADAVDSAGVGPPRLEGSVVSLVNGATYAVRPTPEEVLNKYVALMASLQTQAKIATPSPVLVGRR